MTKNYMLDTTIFNWLIDNYLSIDNLPCDGGFFATRFQWEELSNTANLKSKEKLQGKYIQLIHDATEPRETTVPFMWDTLGSHWGNGVWLTDEQQSLFNKLLSELTGRKINEQRKNNCRKDICIAMASHLNHCILLTTDRQLALCLKNNNIGHEYLKKSISLLTQTTY